MRAMPELHVRRGLTHSGSLRANLDELATYSTLLTFPLVRVTFMSL